MNQLSSKEIYEKTAEIGIYKTSNKLKSTLIGAILAGIFISLGSIGYFNIVPFFPSEFKGLAVFIGGIAFSIGIIAVIFAGAELFTGNSLVSIGAFKGHYSIKVLIKNNFWVLIGNLIGTIFMGLLMSISHIGRWGESAIKSHDYLSHVVISKTEMFMYSNFDFAGWIGILAAAILCNIIVAVIVWMSYAGKTMSDKTLMMVVGIAVFVVSGYEHVVANGYYFAKYIFTELMMNGNFDFEILVAMGLSTIVVAIGNFIGGAIVIGGLYHILHKKH